MLSFKDQLNRTITFKQTPKRIVSLVPSQTELIVDLGLEDSLIGVTKFCVHPKHLRQQKTIVGGTKQVNIDKIKALKPDVILCNKEENAKAMITDLEQIAPVHLSDIYTIDDSLELINSYGKLFDKTLEAKQMVNAIQDKHHCFKTSIEGRSKLKVAYFIWKNPWMVAANHNFIHSMLQLNNFENVFQNLTRYPEIKLSELKEAQLDVILLSSEPFPFKPKDVEALALEFPNTTIKIVDGEAFSWYGSRLLKAFDYFKVLHSTL